MSDTSPVHLRIDAPAATLVLQRPQRCNALDRRTLELLVQMLEDLHLEKRVRAVILTGTGDHFCAGTDLHELQQTFDSPEALVTWHDDTQALLALIETMLRFPKPLLVGVNGAVVGAGLAIMLAADFVIAADTATIRMPESQRGLNPGLTTPLLNFRIGSSAAARLLLTGAPVSAEEARSLGLFHECVHADQVWARCFQVAQQCATGARESHQLTKQMINETLGEQLWTQLAVGAAHMATARTTEAAREGVAAFLEKREPRWD